VDSPQKATAVTLKTTVLGIDPAPGEQGSTLWEAGQASQHFSPPELRALLRSRVTSGERLLIVWDSPLTFDRRQSFSDRLIDKAARSWKKDEESAGRLTRSAVSVLPFCQCPHWTASCYVLGLPFGSRPGWARVPPTEGLGPDPGEALVLEAHPAVALAAWWLEAGDEEPFPITTVRSNGCERLRKCLHPRDLGARSRVSWI
jgi:hypothetical protein